MTTGVRQREWDEARALVGLNKLDALVKYDALVKLDALVYSSNHFSPLHRSCLSAASSVINYRFSIIG